jgi:preprotein translocase SecE subunit
MSRALRRHPVAAPTKPGRQPKAPAIRPSPRRPQGREGHGSWWRPQWAIDIVSELRKVTWPSREDTWYLTGVVLVVAITAGIFLGGVDMFFNWAISHTILR